MTQASERETQLREALEKLVARLHAIHADDRYKAVWQLYAIHGGNYTGPKYEDELREAESTLAASPSATPAKDECWEPPTGEGEQP